MTKRALHGLELEEVPAGWKTPHNASALDLRKRTV
jgi:hypothetical protein